ncbi:interferon-induced protein 44 [Fundulus heteroclitus]|uniref:interferon-induced protein 44 n=1 Tax=Fundulus heteroclitus TaxID=8078 RepID=UPI00165C7C5A|nr:interferon-induced protein 44 [Fundulus heteroclitus]
MSRHCNELSFTVLESPWRKITWGDNGEALQYIKEFQPLNEEVKHIRVLLYGSVGAGKSSFITSINNVIQKRMTHQALASVKTADQSFTKKYETFTIQKEVRGTFYPFVFNDVMGLEEGVARGVRADDLKLALMGHVKEGYSFNPSSCLSADDLYYNSTPTINDRVHVLVCIDDANSPQMKPSVLQKMKEIREAASNLGIPQLAILTHIDEACGETERNIRNVYKSKHLKKKMGDLSSNLGIPMNCILPVKNYSKEIGVNRDVDTLILSALRLMIDFGDDYTAKL